MINRLAFPYRAQIPTSAGGHMSMLFLTNTQAADFNFSGLMDL